VLEASGVGGGMDQRWRDHIALAESLGLETQGDDSKYYFVKVDIYVWSGIMGDFTPY
jgi:hypothetical protein